MIKLLSILVFFIISLNINAQSFEHFPNCSSNSKTDTAFNTDFTCESESPLPSLGEMDDFIEDFNGNINNQNTRLSFITQIEKKLKFITRANKTKLEMQKVCFSQDKSSWPKECEQIRRQIKTSIKNNWKQMNLSLVLGFQKNSAIRYQFGAKEPDLFIHSKTKHPFGGKVKIDSEVKKQAQKVFTSKRNELGSHIDSGLRENLQEEYSKKYTSALNKAPIMALVDSDTPDDQEISNALSKMINNNKKILDKKFDAAQLAGFYPLLNDLVVENPKYCTIANHLVNEKLKKESNQRLLKLGAAGALGVGCIASGWTGIGMSLCFASGALMTGTNLALANKNANFERMRAFTSALDNELMREFDTLSAAEQEQAMELIMAPLAGFGAGGLIKGIAPSTKVLNFTKYFKIFPKKPSVKPITAEQLRQVPSDQVKLVTTASENANQRHFVSDIAELQVGTRNGKDIMIKAHYNEQALLKEAQMYEFVESAGIKTPYQGIATLPDGKKAMISEFVEGGVFKSSVGGYKFFPNSGKQIGDYNLGQHTIDGLTEMETKLRAANINPGDFQVLIRKDGTPVLFDVDVYSKIAPNPDPKINYYSEIQNLRSKLERYLGQ